MIRSSVRRQALLLCLAALVSILFSGAAPTATANFFVCILCIETNSLCIAFVCILSGLLKFIYSTQAVQNPFRRDGLENFLSERFRMMV